LFRHPGRKKGVKKKTMWRKKLFREPKEKETTICEGWRRRHREVKHGRGGGTGDQGEIYNCRREKSGGERERHSTETKTAQVRNSTGEGV